jgi:hypothetical protein
VSACTDQCKKPAPGSRMEHCKKCHQTFSATESGDSHRIGEHGVKEGPDRRRCRTPEEMFEGGMWTSTDSTGKEVWHGRCNPAGVQRRRNPPGTVAGTDLTA